MTGLSSLGPVALIVSGLIFAVGCPVAILMGWRAGRRDRRGWL